METRKKRSFQTLHPKHVNMLRGFVAQRGARRVALESGLEDTRTVERALRGEGLYPNTIGKLVTYLSGATGPAVSPERVSPPPAAAPTTDQHSEIALATGLVVEAMRGVSPENRTKVLDAVRVILG